MKRLEANLAVTVDRIDACESLIAAIETKPEHLDRDQKSLLIQLDNAAKIRPFLAEVEQHIRKLRHGISSKPLYLVKEKLSRGVGRTIPL